MKTLLIAALTASLFSVPARAEEGEPTTDEAKPEEGKGEPKAETKPEEPKAAVAPAAPVAPEAKANQPLVVEGAPLGNASVHVHIIEKKPYTNAGRHEIVVYPAVPQINSKFSAHVGAAAMYSYHMFENLALQVTPLFNYINRESTFNEELINKGRQQAQAATALLLQYGAAGGMEVTPMYGKFAFYEGWLGHFTFVLNAGAGAANTRIQLRPESPDCKGDNCKPAAFGATGLKFVGSVGAGFRVYLGARAAVRIEVRDLIYTARVDKINGCTFRDIDNLERGSTAETATCNPDEFINQEDKPLARKLLEETSSDVLNNVSFYGGFSFLF